MSDLEKDIKNFVINFTDGTSSTVDKGFFVKFTENDDNTTTVQFNVVGCSEKDLKTIVLSCIRMGEALDMFEDADDPDNEN